MFKLSCDVPLQPLNTFGISAKALQLVRIQSTDDLQAVLADASLEQQSKFVLGGGSNLVLTGDVKPLVLKVEIMGKRLVKETRKHFIVEAGAGEPWHDFVAWTLDQNMPGLENLALIPGTVGASPVQNIGAYGVELQDRFESLDYIDLTTGESQTLDAGACQFGYRDSVFKCALKDKVLITHVRFALPKAWQVDISYADLDKHAKRVHQPKPTPRMVFDWVCQIRSKKLPDPKVIGNTGSFFKNPVVTPEQCKDIIGRDPNVAFYKLLDGNFKLAAAWLIDACGWKGRGVGNAGVHPEHALVLINKGQETGTPATGGEVMTLAGAIQTSVYERFGIRLEVEPVVV
ncbi:MAG: UDP-N-acetylmuramate dehydrogenase [Cytophagales bacterium]|nr:UDP-N-acetylmuramate dehydrogenase [Cytophagales bacterium]